MKGPHDVERYKKLLATSRTERRLMWIENHQAFDRLGDMGAEGNSLIERVCFLDGILRGLKVVIKSAVDSASEDNNS